MVSLYTNEASRTMVRLDASRKNALLVMAPSYTGIIEETEKAAMVLADLESKGEIEAGTCEKFRSATAVSHRFH